MKQKLLENLNLPQLMVSQQHLVLVYVVILFFAVSSATCISKERVADIVTGIVVVYFNPKTGHN